MNQLLRAGQTVKGLTTGATYTIRELIGSGEQGEVYKATTSGSSLALKWYFAQYATNRQQHNLEGLAKSGPPNDRFLWPIEIVQGDGTPSFGYVMPLRDPRYKGIVDLMKRRTEPSFFALATAALELAHSYLQLHARGYCYCDISFGNVFFDPATGQVLICDNDNVAVDGDKHISVFGTPRFMAPEVVMGAMPSTKTDLYSLAVLLHYMFIIHHPLDGQQEASIKCMDIPAMNKLYGSNAVYIFDLTNETNRPVRGLHDNALAFWPIYPQFLRDLFIKSFTDGIRDSLNGRVRESEWRSAMVQLRDSIFYCGHCGAENFYDLGVLSNSISKPASCWACRRALQLPPRIKIGRQVVMLNRDTKLYPHHVDDSMLYSFDKAIGEIVQHPKDPTIWGLKNLSSEKWVCIHADNVTLKDVEPQKSVTLSVGTRINFGRSTGEIRI